MSPLLRIKLGYDKSLRSVNLFLRKSSSFFSTVNGGGHPDFLAPVEPIANRPMRGQQSKFPKPNRRWENENRNLVKGESDDKFLERLKLGFDRKAETPHKPELTDGKTENVKPPPQLSLEDADEIFKKIKETGLIPNAVAMLDS